MKLTGKIALVTGASRGIGFAIAKILSENGSRWVEAGILVFYILFIIAIGLMFLSGLRKMLKK